jgi:hypothetical protein
MEASQTRDYCAAKGAAHRAARPGPSATIELSLQDDKSFSPQKEGGPSATIELSLQDDKSLSLPKKEGGPSAAVGLALRDDNVIGGGH